MNYGVSQKERLKIKEFSDRSWKSKFRLPFERSKIDPDEQRQFYICLILALNAVKEARCQKSTPQNIVQKPKVEN